MALQDGDWVDVTEGPQWWWKFVMPAWSIFIGVILVAHNHSEVGIVRLGWVSIAVGVAYLVVTRRKATSKTVPAK